MSIQEKEKCYELLIIYKEGGVKNIVFDGLDSYNKMIEAKKEYGSKEEVFSIDHVCFQN